MLTPLPTPPPGLSLFTYVVLTTLLATGYRVTRSCLSLIGHRRKKLVIKGIRVKSYREKEGNVLSIFVPEGTRTEPVTHEYKVHCMPGDTINLGEFITPRHKTREILSARVYDAEKDEYHPCTENARTLSGPRGDFFGRDVPLSALLSKDHHIQYGHLEYTTSDGYIGGRRILGVCFTTKKKDTSAVRIMPEFLRGK